METLDKLIELDDKHNDLLEQLAQLDAKVTQTLNEWGSASVQQIAQNQDVAVHPTSRTKAA